MFINTSKEWICENCGRRVPLDGSEYSPAAKCRLPERFIKKNPDNISIVNKIASIPITGVGTELDALLKKIGIQYNKECACRSKISLMDKNGIEWCEKNFDSIIKWMKDESIEKNIPFAKKAARALLKLAIKKSKNHLGYNPH